MYFNSQEMNIQREKYALAYNGDWIILNYKLANNYLT